MSPAQRASTAYAARVAHIQGTMDRGTREFSDAMTEASLTYERAMTADIGLTAAAKPGAGLPRLQRK